MVENYWDGAVTYDVTRLSWAEAGRKCEPVVLRSFGSRWEAHRWMEDTEERQRILHDVAIENLGGFVVPKPVDDEGG